MFVQELLGKWREDKLCGSLWLCWLATVFFSFWGDSLISIPFPGIGTLFPFRILLPITFILYIIWVIRTKERLLENVTTIEKLCYSLIVIMLAYGALSLFRAIEVEHTFRKLFNLTMDLCFFFLMLRLCRNEELFRQTVLVCVTAAAILCLMGVYEVFFGGIFDSVYDGYKWFLWFSKIFQAPIVTYGNTNDYLTSMVMCCGIFILAICHKWNVADQKRLCLLSVSIPLVFFLARASNARLVLVAIYILLVGLTIFLVICDRKRLWIPCVMLVLMGGVYFANQYRYIVPPVKQYIAEMKEYRQQEALSQEVVPQGGASQEEKPQEEKPQEETPVKPQLQLGDPRKETLEEQFFTVNVETQEKELRVEGSAGVRARLLLHTWNCFKESYGFGVGLGNTELLARDREVIEGAKIWSIHCFVARIIADFGIFVLIPLSVIGVLLLKQIWESYWKGVKRKQPYTVAFAVLYLFVLMTYPFTSTASSDAQDLLAMWIYLGGIIVFYNSLPERTEQ